MIDTQEQSATQKLYRTFPWGGRQSSFHDQVVNGGCSTQMQQPRIRDEEKF
jgi:hypothetical protein